MKTLYPAVKNTLNMTNAIALPEKIIYKTFADRTTDTINIGFMGKLCEEKGIFDAIKVLSKLMEEGENVKLMIAGSVGSSEIKNQINNLVNEYGDRHIKYLGPVFGADKENFYNNIDVFLFPTRYINETQGIVNIEAMSYGVPVVAFGRCCVPTDVGEDGGLIVPVGGDYVACATSYIKEMNSSSEIYNKRRLDAHCQFKKIKKQSHKEYSEFLKLM
jgi:glycosyltransferase involved in cell wall biosynthesis